MPLLCSHAIQGEHRVSVIKPAYDFFRINIFGFIQGDTHEDGVRSALRVTEALGVQLDSGKEL